MVNKIQIYFRDELIADFFAGVFKSSHRGDVKLSRHHDIGKYICSLIRYSDIKPDIKQPPQGYKPVNVIIPDYPNSNAVRYWLYLTKEDNQRINDFVKSIFHQEFKAFLIMGQELRILQKDSIEIFMANYRLDMKKHSGLVKKDYRWRMDVMEKIQELAKTLGK